MSLFTPGSQPGFTTSITSTESQIFYAGRQGETTLTDVPVEVASAAVDAGNTSLTTTLRGGLIMVQTATNGQVNVYKGSGVTGTIVGILPKSLRMLNSAGVAEVKYTNLFSRGMLRAAEIPNLDYAAAAQLVALGFVFDNPLYNRAYGVMKEVTITGATTATAADHGTRWIFNGASANITLPEIISAGPVNISANLGLEFEVYRYHATGNATFITANSGSLPCFAGPTSMDDASVVTAALGQRMRVVCRELPNGYRYVAELISGPA